MIALAVTPRSPRSARAAAPAQLGLPFPSPDAAPPRPVLVTCDICGAREQQLLRLGESRRPCSRCRVTASRRRYQGSMVTLRGPGLQELGSVPGELRGREVVPYRRSPAWTEHDERVWQTYCRLHDEAEARELFGGPVTRVLPPDSRGQRREITTPPNGGAWTGVEPAPCGGA